VYARGRTVLVWGSAVSAYWARPQFVRYSTHEAPVLKRIA
jgi:uncharacterized membrane protein